MHVGTQLVAPKGWGSISKDEICHFAGRSDHGVLLVTFYTHKEYWRVKCLHIKTKPFEKAMSGVVKQLQRKPEQCTLPPWLKGLEEFDFESAEGMRYKKKKKTYTDQTGGRKAAIQPLLDMEAEILGSLDPLAVIARIGRQSAPGEHPYRLQLWFFAFILYSRNDWALKSANHTIGLWDRNADKYCSKKFGRTYKSDGDEYGWSSIHFSEKVVAIYLRHCDEYKSMMSIYIRAMEDDFGCEVQKLDAGKRRVYHPSNEPYPSYSQFRQIVVNEFGLDQVQIALYGHVRMRNKAPVNQGSYVSQFKNVLESVQVDAYRCHDRPRASFSVEAMPVLIVARAVCVKSGAIVGVGFSLGGEKREAYRSMLLSMVLPKSVVARIYGIPKEMLDWPMQGMCPSFLSDRGPAGIESLLDQLEEKIPIKSIAPSYEPRSKPNVEGSNPKSVKQEGEPSYVLSEHDLPGMMRREIMHAVRQNRSKDITSHMSEEEIDYFKRNGLPATPQAYWIYLTDRLLTSGYSMTANQAIKAFCKPVKLDVDGIGVCLETRHYSSDVFRTDGLHAKALRIQPKGLKGYCVPLATRYIWMEFAGRFLDLEALKSGSSDGDDYFIPLSVLAELGESLAELQSRTRKSGNAAKIEVEKDFKKLTGKAWDAGMRRKGTPKNGRGTSAHEAAVMNDKARRAA